MRLTNKPNAPQRRLTLIGVIRSGEFEPQSQSYAEFGIGKKNLQFMIESLKMFFLRFLWNWKRPHIVKIRRIEHVRLAYLIKVETKNISV